MHVPVLLQEVVEGLELGRFPIGWIIDGTLNDGGHAKEILQKYSHISILGTDIDEDAIKRVSINLEKEIKDKRIIVKHSSYVDMKVLAEQLAIQPVVGVILDLGISSEHVDVSGRGFSFAKDEPLLMTFGVPTEDTVTAYTVVNKWSQETLETIIRGFGEERYAGRIARVIVERRQESPIETSKELADIVFSAVPGAYRRGPIHPATRTFQAIRIATNRELDTVKQGLEAAWEVLEEKGRLVVISFHSLEDRIVKQFYMDKKRLGEGLIITKKPVTPTDEEVEMNRRSRSAKLRIIEKIS